MACALWPGAPNTLSLLCNAWNPRFRFSRATPPKSSLDTCTPSGGCRSSCGRETPLTGRATCQLCRELYAGSFKSHHPCTGGCLGGTRAPVSSPSP